MKREIRKVACVGEVMIELSPNGEHSFKSGVAGDTFNTAVYLARGLRGGLVKVSYVTALGVDRFSDEIMSELVTHGLNAYHVERRSDRNPGLYAIQTDDRGERSFSYWRSMSAARTLFSTPCEIGLEMLNAFDLVFMSGITLAILPASVRNRIFDWADLFSANGGTLVYDSNHRPKLWEDVSTARAVNSAMWARADIALPSIDDEMDLFGDRDEAALVARLRDAGVRRGVLKRGAAGPLDLATGQGLGPFPSVENVVDSTAAGDSFNAGFLAAHIQGEADATAARAGHDLASYVIGFPGAIVPDR